MLEELKAREYETLTVDERIIVTTSTNLIKHFKGMESAGIIDAQNTAKFIGSVKKLASVACIALGAQNRPTGHEEGATINS